MEAILKENILKLKDELTTQELPWYLVSDLKEYINIIVNDIDAYVNARDLSTYRLVDSTYKVYNRLPNMGKNLLGLLLKYPVIPSDVFNNLIKQFR